MYCDVHLNGLCIYNKEVELKSFLMKITAIQLLFSLKLDRFHKHTYTFCANITVILFILIHFHSNKYHFLMYLMSICNTSRFGGSIRTFPGMEKLLLIQFDPLSNEILFVAFT